MRSAPATFSAAEAMSEHLTYPLHLVSAAGPDAQPDPSTRSMAFATRT